MVSDVKYNKELLLRAESRAMNADLASDEGFFELRTALMELLCVDAYCFKGKGSSTNQKRLLPDIEKLFNHEGIVLSQRSDVDLFPDRRAAVGRADSGHLIREISYALVDGGHSWDYRNGEQVLRACRMLYVGNRSSLSERLRGYLEKRSAFVDEHHIATVDVSFTAPALKWFVLNICDSYRSCMCDDGY